MGTDSEVAKRNGLHDQIDILRQMLLLAVGVDHPAYRDLDDAFTSDSPERMREALAAFESLPDVEKQYALGLDHYQDEQTGTD